MFFTGTYITRDYVLCPPIILLVVFARIEMSDLRYKGLLNEGVQDWD